MNFADTVVIGAGLYGCCIAEAIAKAAPAHSVLLVEERADILQRSSGHNQARVHNGYHYPRDLRTARRSHANCQRFINDWADAIRPQDSAVYALATYRSHVSATQFEQFCAHADLPLRPVTPSIWQLFEHPSIASAYSVEEFTFNIATIRTIMLRRLKATGVRLAVKTRAEAVTQHRDGRIRIDLTGQSSGRRAIEAVRVVNSTYCQIDQFTQNIGPIPYQLQSTWTRMALVALPRCFRGLSITVMDGPFFSIVPDPQSALHLLSHVYYTPRQSCIADTELPSSSPAKRADDYKWFSRVRTDCARYVPRLADAQLRGFVVEHKMLPKYQDRSAARPIVIAQSSRAPGVLSVTGSKLDNVYDAISHIQKILPLSGENTLSQSMAWHA